MRFKIIICIFGMMFFTSYGNTMETEKIKVMEERILEKELELERIKKEKEEYVKKINKDEEIRPKIGLVLGGGGAKGIAHIGVLRVLEEYDIPIDYITGTSFGGIVGSLYASGYSVNEIESMLLDMNWDEFRSNHPDRKYTSMTYKKELEKYFLNFEIDDEWNVKLLQGVLNGENFYLKLKSMLQNSEGITDFDDLPIPFRAISTNINTGKRHVAKDGDLAKAVFMSMALPAVFEPVEDNGQFYIDGGLIDNLPVEEVINMGADIVIAVDVSANVSVIDKGSNVFQIMDKISAYRNYETFKESSKLADILIVPDVKNHSTADFTNLEELMEKGEVEAEKHKDQLIQLSSNMTKKKEVHKKTSFQINEVVLINNKKLKKQRILDVSDKGVPAVYSEEELMLWMDKIKEVSILNRFFYKIEDEKLIIEVQEKDSKHLDIGLNISNDFDSSLRLALGGSTFDNVERDYLLVAELSRYPKLELKTLGKRRLGELQFLNYIGLGAKMNPLFIYKNHDKISDYTSNSVYAHGEIATVLFDTYLIGAGIEGVLSKNEYQSGTRQPDFKKIRNYYKGNFFLESDSRDKISFTTTGRSDRAEIFIGDDGDAEFYGGYFDVNGYIPVNRKINLEIFLSGGIIKGDSIPEAEYYKIGGIRSKLEENRFSFYGMNAMRKYVDQFYMGGINFRYNIASIFYANVRYNAITYSDSRRTSLNENLSIGDKFKHGVGIGLGLDSLVGPLEIVISNDIDSDGVLFSLFLGYEF